MEQDSRLLAYREQWHALAESWSLLQSRIEDWLAHHSQGVETLEALADLHQIQREIRHLHQEMESLHDNFVGAMLRRLLQQPYRDSGTHLDLALRHLVGPNGSVPLTGFEWDIMELLMANELRAVTFAEIAGSVWQLSEEQLGRSLIYDKVSRLRQRLVQVGSNYQIVSVPRYGYLLGTSS
jgi:DNA-binding response OmpR family regulator